VCTYRFDYLTLPISVSRSCLDHISLLSFQMQCFDTDFIEINNNMEYWSSHSSIQHLSC